MDDFEKKPLITKGQPYVDNNNEFKPFGLFWNIVKSFAGAGTFALPWAVMNAGLWTGVVGIVIFAVFSTYTINTLLQCGKKVIENNSKYIQTASVIPPSYSEIGRAAVGELGAILVSVYSGLMCFGVCIAYFILISGNMSSVITQLSVNEVILLVLPICMFLSCLTDLRLLAYSSVGGSVALVVAMVSVVVYGLDHHLLKPISEYPVINWEHIPLFMGNAAFLFCDHVVVMPLAKGCGNYSKFPNVLSWAVTFVTILNVVFAGLAYGFFLGDTKGNVIDNLPDKDILATIVRVGISLEVLASFPLVISAAFQALETVSHTMEIIKPFPRTAPDAPHPLFSRNILYYAFRCGIIVLLAGAAIGMGQKFGDFVSLVGSFTIMATGFVFPQWFYLRLFHFELSPVEKAVQYAVIVFGVGMTGLGTFQACDSLFGNH